MTTMSRTTKSSAAETSPATIRRLARHTARTMLAAAVLAAVAGSAQAGPFGDLYEEYQRTRAHGKASLAIAVDNDSLLLNKDDGFYTSGARLHVQYRLGDGKQETGFGWRIGQELYTPSDIKLPPALISPRDHPYAGWLYAGAFREVQRADGEGWRIGLDIGCLGPCAGGEWTQRRLHSLLNQPLPEGWSRQVRTEWGAVLYGDYTPVRWTLGEAFDLAPNVHGRFGNIHTDAGVGLTLRGGRLNLLPGQPTLHGYLRVDATAVGYNATMQGGAFSKNDPHTVRPKRLVGEAEAGLAWTSDSGRVGLRASVVRRSNEVDGLSNAIGAQNFARILFTWTP